MAAPSKSIAVALLVVFATVVTPSLQQAAAIRAKGAETKVVVATAPPPRGAPIHLMKGGMLSNFPCIPFLPKIVRDLCNAVFKAPKPECRPLLKGEIVSSCTGFLTNSSVPQPPEACCNQINKLYSDPASKFCFCHIANGDIGQLLPAPLKRKRAITVLTKCDIGLSAHWITYFCIDQPSNNPQIPPMDKPAPPQEDDSDENKA